MAATTSTSHEEQSPAPAGAFADAGFADSGIMDMTTPTLSPQSKPQFETDLSESVEDGAYDHLVDYSTEAVLSDSDPATVSEFEPDPELISHLTTTVSSLRLRGQEQLHIYALFTSKIEALAQRSLQHEATIRDLTSQLQSIRESNTTLGRENAMLAHENNDLRVTMQDLKGDVVEREIAMEAMTGAVRGLEGWIESANNSPGRIRNCPFTVIEWAIGWHGKTFLKARVDSEVAIASIEKAVVASEMSMGSMSPLTRSRQRFKRGSWRG